MSATPEQKAVAEQTDYDVAKAIRDGKLQSPQKFGEFWLFDLRITGSGAAYRSSIDEYTFRDPAVWLTDDFVERCNGLAVIFEHPEEAGLNSDEYRNRSIGSVVLPYVKGDEVWGVAKIFDEAGATLMQTTHRSTSPGVLTGANNAQVKMPDGEIVLNENAPVVLDHVAVCESGVWDKGGHATGIRNDAMADKKEGEKKYGDVKFADPANDKYPIDTDEHIRAAWDYIHKEKDADKYSADDLAAIKRRIVAAWKDKIDKAGPPEASRKDSDMADDKKPDGEPAEDAVKKDSDISAKLDAICARMDALEKRDAKKDADEPADKKAEDDKKDARKDADEPDDKGDNKDAKKDADGEAKSEDVRATEAALKDARKDTADIDALKAEIDRLKASMAGISREPTIDEREQVGAAYRRADSVYQMLGLRTPEALPGENPIAYRKRLAAKIQHHSKTYGDFRMDSQIDPRAFDLIEREIYADAEKVARTPDDSAPMRLIPHVTQEFGKTYTRFHGDAAAAWAPFMPPVRNRIVKFNQARKGI